MKNSLMIALFIMILAAVFVFWRRTQSPGAREARLRAALENHETAAAEKIVNQ